MASVNDRAHAEGSKLEGREQMGHGQAAKRRRARRHPIAWTVGVLIFLCFILFLLIPTFLSTRWGANLVGRGLSQTMPGSVHLGRLRLSWVGSQSASDIELLNPSGKRVATIESVTVSASLWRLLWGSTDLGQVRIVKPMLTISFTPGGESDLREALGSNLCSPVGLPVARAGLAKSRRPRLYTGTYSITGGTIVTELPTSTTVRFEQLAFSFALPRSLRNISVFLSTDVVQDSKRGRIGIEADALRVEQKSASFRLLPTQGSALDAEMANVPVAGLDGLLSGFYPEFQGVLTELLGPVLSAHSQASVARGFQLEAHSAHLQAAATGELQQSRLQLTGPARAELTITPLASEKIFPLLPRAANMRLVEPATLAFDLPTLEMAWSGSDLSDMRGEGRLSLKGVQLVHPFTGPFSLQRLEIDALLNGRSQRATLTSTLVLAMGDLLGQINAHLEDEAFLIPGSVTSFALRSDRFPTPLFEPFVHKQGLLPDLFGPWLSLLIEGKWGETTGHLTASAESETLKLPPFSLRLGQEIELEEPSELRLSLRPIAWTKLMPSGFPFRLLEPAELALAITDFSMPQAWPVFPSQMRLNAAFSGPHIHLTGLPQQGVVSLRDVHALLSGEPLADLMLEGVVEIFFPNSTGAWVRAIGDTLPITLHAQGQVGSNWVFNFPRFLLWVQSRLFSLRAEAALQDYRDLRLLAPVEVHYTATPDWTRSLTSSSGLPLLAEPAELNLRIAPTTFDLSQLALSQMTLSAHLGATRIAFAGSGTPQLDGVTADAVLNDPLNTLRVSFSGATSAENGGRQGRLAGTVAAANFLSDGKWRWCDATLRSQITGTAVPTLLLGTLGRRGDLDHIWGPFVDLQLTTALRGLCPPQGEFSARFDANNFHASCALLLAEELSLRDPAQPIDVRWRVTPEGFAALLARAPYRPPLLLAQPTEITARVEALNWPLKGRAPASDKPLLALSGSAMETQLQLDRTREELLLSHWGLRARVASDHSLSLEAGGQATETGSVTPQTGDFSLHLSYNRQAGTPSLKLDSQLAHFSTRWLLALLPIQPSQVRPLALLLGHQTSGSATAQLVAGEGSLELDFEASRASAQVRARIEQGLLYLTAPLTAQATIDPELGLLVLRSLNPLLLSTARSDQPATLTISPEGFSLPVRPLDLARLNLGSGELDLNQLWIANRGSVALMLALFPASSTSSQSEMRAWATPIYFEARDGTITLKRADLLLDRSLQLATWGSLSLPQNRLRLTVAVPGYSLRKVLRMDGIPDSEYLLLPVRGSLQGASIDYPRAAAAIAAIVARATGRVEGIVTGMALDIVTGTARKKTEIPPPTTQPFPWANEVEWPPYQRK
jgi:hypothetical protein